MPLRQLPSGDPSSELIESLPSPTSVVSAESPSVVSAESEGLPPPVIAAAAANVFVGSASPAAIAAASARAFGSCGASRGSSGTARVQVPGCYMELQAATMCHRLLHSCGFGLFLRCFFESSQSSAFESTTTVAFRRSAFLGGSIPFQRSAREPTTTAFSLHFAFHASS